MTDETGEVAVPKVPKKPKALPTYFLTISMALGMGASTVFDLFIRRDEFDQLIESIEESERGSQLATNLPPTSKTYAGIDITDSSAIAQRLLLAHRESASDKPLFVMTSSKLGELRKGDELLLTVRLICIKCTDREIRLDVTGVDASVSPASMLLPIAPETDVERRFVVSATSSGAKTILVNATGEPSKELYPSIVAKVNVLPPLSVVGIPEPYVDLALRTLQAIGFSALFLFGLNQFFDKKPAAKP